MFREKPIRNIHLADQQFANKIVGKYGWRIDNGFARSKLQHRIEPKKRDAMTFAKSPIIQLTKVIQPLHIKLIYEYHQLNQIIQYKNAPLLVSPPLSNVALGTTVDVVPNTATQRSITLLEKVKQTAQMKAQRQRLQQVQSQIERRTILTTSHHMQGDEAIVAANSQQSNSRQAQATAKLVRTSLVSADEDSNQTILTATNQASNQTPLATVNNASHRISSTALSSGINANSSSHPNNYSMNGLHHIEHVETTQRVNDKQVAVAKIILSPYIRNIVREEQERITAELIERNTRYRKKAVLYETQLDESQVVKKREVLDESQVVKKREVLRETQAVTHAEIHSVARKAMINKSLSTVLEQWHRKLTIAQITMLRQQKQQGVRLRRSESQHEILRTNLEQRNQTIVNDMKYYLKTTAHHINTIKYHQRTLQGVQKLVYIPLVNRDAATVNEKATLIYRNPLTQVDSRITINQHSHKQEITNNERSHMQEIINNKHSHNHKESSNIASLATRQIAIITGEATKKQQRRIEATGGQIRSVTSFHQQLIERNERLIYQIEMVEKKKTPRARKLSLVPVVKLSYRVLPEEQRRGFVRMPQAQPALDKGRQAELPSPLLLKQAGIRRQAELIYTVNRNHQSSNDQQTTRQITQQVSQQASQAASQQVMKQVSQQITQEVTQQVSQQASQAASQQVTKRVSQQVSHEVSRQVSQQVPQQASQQVREQTTQHKPTNLKPTLARAITLTNEERMKQRAGSTSLSNELITQRPQYTKLSITSQLTHISKVNKTQLLQVKVLQSKLKQLQAVTLIVPQTSRMGATSTNSGATNTNYINDQSDQSSSNRNDTLRTTIGHSTESVRVTSNDGSLSVIQTNYNVKHSQLKQLYYRVNSNNSTQQLGALINELQKASSRITQSVTNNAEAIDTQLINKPLYVASIAMNSIATKRINLIHSSQQQGERLTKRFTTLSKVKDIISTQSPLSIVQVKPTNEQNLQLIVNEQSSKRTSQIVEQVRRNTHSSMNLHIAKQQSKQQDDTKQQDAVKQLEVTVKRLEQELSTTKETKKQPSINIRQLSDQLFDQISKKIRLEQHRNGR